MLKSWVLYTTCQFAYQNSKWTWCILHKHNMSYKTISMSTRSISIIDYKKGFREKYYSTCLVSFGAGRRAGLTLTPRRAPPALWDVLGGRGCGMCDMLYTPMNTSTYIVVQAGPVRYSCFLHMYHCVEGSKYCENNAIVLHCELEIISLLC